MHFPKLQSFNSTPPSRLSQQMPPDFEMGRVQAQLREALGALDLRQLFNRGEGAEGEAVQDAAAYFDEAEMAEVARLLEEEGEEHGGGGDEGEGVDDAEDGEEDGGQ